VNLINQNRTVSAQKAEINLIENNCKLEGNVHINQRKTSSKDLPVSINSQEAVLNLTTNEITFQGSLANPVSTILSLNEYEPLQKKSLKSKKQKRRHE
jgi:lipopolysaccharide export system protein LptA